MSDRQPHHQKSGVPLRGTRLTNLRRGVPDLQLENISKKFNRLAAVKNVNLEIGEGSSLTLLGPSGCGKTTTLRMIDG